MANYCCAVRTNYFHVKDPDAFKELMKNVACYEDNVSVWESKDEIGNTVFGFGCYGSILGFPVHEEGDNEDDDYEYDDYDFDEFANRLSEIVADDDAIIIQESGNEKLRYLVGSATIITHNGIKYLDIDTIAAETAANMIGRPFWKTRMTY